MKYYVGVDIGGTEINIVLLDEYNKIIHAKPIGTESIKGFKYTVKIISEHINDLLYRNNISITQIEYIGLGIPGLTDGIKKVYLAPNIKWEDIDIVEVMQEHYPETKILIANDASVAALAEQRFGSIKGVKNAVMLTLGTGIGGGVIINNKLYNGSNGIASEIGHMILGDNFYNCSCGNNGCFETFCSATGIKRYARRLLEDCKSSRLLQNSKNDPDFITSKLVFEEFKNKDLMAQVIVKRFVTYLAIGLSNLINVYDPEVFVLGGGVSNSFDLFINDLQEEFDEKLTFKTAPKPKIVKASLGTEAGAIGAALIGQFL